MGLGSALAVPVLWLAFLAIVSVTLSAILSAGEEAGRAVTKAGATEAKVLRHRSATAIMRIAEESYAAVRTTAYVRLVLEMTGAVALTLIAVHIFDQWWSVLGAAVSGAALIMLFVVAVSPRSVGRRNPVGVLRFLAPVMLLLARVGTPIMSLRNQEGEDQPSLSEDEELQAMVDRVAESAEIEDDERQMLHSVFELSHTLVREIMVPRTDMLTIGHEKPIEDALNLFVQSGYSRIPVIADSFDDVRGVLYLKDALRYTWHNPEHSGAAVHQLMRKPVFLPEMKLVDETLEEMRTTGLHIAIVFDEYGGVAGLVTIEDILEELVGDLTDEHDRNEPEVQQIPGGYLVPARLPLSELGDLFGLDLVDEDVDSTGGIVAKALGHVPILGAKTHWNGLSLEVVEMFGRRKLLHTVAVTRDEDE